MSRIDELIRHYCPNGVPFAELGTLCKVETGKLNANAAVEDGEYLFFTTAEETRRIDTWRWDDEALLVAGNGDVGAVKHYKGKFEAYQRTYVLTEFASSVTIRFLFFVLESSLQHFLQQKSHKAVMTYIVLGTLKSFRIPIPPLEVQCEIVKILDTFSALEAELEAELEARIQQYEHYSRYLLEDSLESGRFSVATVDELCAINRGRVISKDYLAKNSGPYPVYSSQTANEGIFGFIDTYDFDDEESITWTTDGAHAGSVFYHSNKKFNITNVCGRLVVKDDRITHRYLYFQLRQRAKRFVHAGMGNPKLMANHMGAISIPVPSLDEQHRVVEILDRFDALINDLSTGLPAEITARRQQYEYYRDKLLAFKELVAAP